jgi:hypothetical protein
VGKAFEVDLGESEGLGLGRGGGGDAEVPGPRECGSSAVEVDMMRRSGSGSALLGELGDGLCTTTLGQL